MIEWCWRGYDLNDYRTHFALQMQKDIKLISENGNNEHEYGKKIHAYILYLYKKHEI